MVAVGLAAGCPQALPYEGAFQLPTAAAVLQPEVGGPYQEPVGFVANGHGGEIIPLALKEGIFLNDDPTASFLRTNPLATGAERRLTSVAVTSGSPNEVTLWAGDAAEGALLRIPYLYDCALTPDRPECAAQAFGAPVEQAAYWQLLEEPGTASLTGVSVTKGYTTTELWTIEYDGGTWSVEGSRSGRQPKDAVTGVRYEAEYHRLEFTIDDPNGAAKVGDRFVVRTENGLSEIDVGGTPLAMTASADLRSIAMIVQDRATDRPVVRWFDPVTRERGADVTLAADAWPHRLAWAEDGALLVTDRDHPAVWEIPAGGDTAIEHVMPWPTFDVASLDGADRRRLYVVPLDADALWLFDRDTDAPIDVNPSLEGDQGLPFRTSIGGIEALRLPHLMQEYSDDGIRITGRSIVIALTNNRVVFAHEDTGCLVQDNFGPRTASGSTGLVGPGDYQTSFEGVAGGPYLEIQGASDRHVDVNTCAGIAPSEGWSVRYDQIAQAWRVEGALSGPQQSLAREDERYLSDGGEISFVIRAGSTPSQDAWTIQFTVDGGVAEADGDNDGDGVAEISLGIAGDPVYFQYRVGIPGPIGDHDVPPGWGGGWVPVDLRPYALVPGASSNQVGRIDPQRAMIEVEWQ